MAIITLMAIVSYACSDRTPTTPTPVPPPSPPAQALRVTGRVIDYRTGTPVPGVIMRWRGTNDAPGQQFDLVGVDADASGNFSAVLPVADAFQINFEPNIYQSAALVRVPGKQLQTDLIVNAGSCVMRYGTVIDKVTRQPIAGATVRRAGTVVTDASGNYRIEIGCEPRDYTYWGIGTTILEVTHPAYAAAFVFDGRREHTSGSGIRRVDFALQPR
jgi:hypothetical protein